MARYAIDAPAGTVALARMVMNDNAEILAGFECATRALLELLKEAVNVPGERIGNASLKSAGITLDAYEKCNPIAEEIAPIIKRVNETIPWWRRAWYAAYHALPQMREVFYLISAPLGFDNDQNLTAEWLVRHVRLEPYSLQTAFRQFPKIEDAIAKLNVTNTTAAIPVMQKAKTKPMSKVAKAMHLLVKNPKWSNKQIAEAVGCHEKYLSNSKQFRQARNLLKSNKDGLARGSKDNDSGHMESWDD
ncbi:MAG TPA: hypothetical protein VGG19_20685 [Tepidisphaeraceae bacterium]